MAAHGTIGEFDRGQEDWSAYCERLEQYFVANDVQDLSKQRAVLLSMCGAATYQLIRNLVAPKKPTEKSFKDLVKLVSEHHTPPPSATMQRFKFNSRSQKDGESVAEFIAELRRLSEHCEFGDNLDDMLRDRLVCGTKDVRVRRRLLAEEDLKFKKAFEIAQAAEAADSNAKYLQKPSASTVHAVQRQPTKLRPVGADNCYRCGGKHAASDCRFREAECHHCHKKGHIARACRSKGKQAVPEPQQRRHRPNKKPPQQTFQVSEEGEDTPYTMFVVRGERAPQPIKVTVNVNGTNLVMEVDTGATTSIISETTYQKLWPKNKAPALQPSEKRLCTYTREALVVKGAIQVTAQYEGQAAQLELIVVAGDGPSLFGRDWLQVITLDWASLHMVRQSQSVQEILDKHAEAFKEELGLVKEATAKIHVNPTAKPKFCRPRTLPYALRGKVEQELERLERSGIIEPIQFSD